MKQNKKKEKQKLRNKKNYKHYVSQSFMAKTKFIPATSSVYFFMFYRTSCGGQSI